MKINTLRKNYWTDVLTPRGLESPGRPEAVKAAQEYSKAKKENESNSKKKKK